jgi:hypothetical protein
MLGSQLKIFIAALGLAILAAPAFADAIDGNWCHTDGRRFSIRGPEIITPGGTRIEGNYSRHWFSYTAPAPEPSAAQTIFMTLADENTVYLRRGEAATAQENLGALRAVGQFAAGIAAGVVLPATGSLPSP